MSSFIQREASGLVTFVALALLGSALFVVCATLAYSH